jgi:uncharacterized membrane protein
MSLYDALKSVHVLAIAVWLGAAFLQLLLAERACRADPEERLWVAQSMVFTGARLFPAASGIALLTGIWMVLDADFVGFGDAWVSLAMTGWLVSTVAGAVFIDRAVAAAVAGHAAGRPEAADAGYRRALLFSRLDVAILALVVVDMVVKPG